MAFSIKDLFIGYSILAGVIAVIIALTWPMKKYEDPQESLERERNSINTPNMAPKKSRISTILKQIFNIHFLYLNLLTGLLIMKSNFYLSTSFTQLNLITNNQDQINNYEAILSLLIPIIGFVVGPIGLVVDKLGLNAGAFFLIALSILSSVLGMIKIMPLQIVKFVTFSMYFPYIYGYWCTFLAYKFGFDNFGVLFGVVAVTAGCVNFVGDPLANYITTPTLESEQEHRLFVVNLAMLAASAACLIYPIISVIYNLTHKKEQQEENKPLLHVGH